MTRRCVRRASNILEVLLFADFSRCPTYTFRNSKHRGDVSNMPSSQIMRPIGGLRALGQSLNKQCSIQGDGLAVC
jgi:hypothetical protein